MLFLGFSKGHESSIDVLWGLLHCVVSMDSVVKASIDDTVRPIFLV